MKYALAVLLLAPMQDEEVTIESLIGWMTKHTGKKFVYEDQLAVNVMKRKVHAALDEKRAYEVGLAVLRLNYVAALPQDDGSVHLVMSQQAMRMPLRVYSSADALPKVDEYCCLTLQIKHAGMRDVHAALINLVQPQCVVPVESSGTLIVSDFAPNLRKVAEIVRVVDVPRRATGYRMSVALLEGTAGDASVPEAYRAVDLSPTGRSKFTAIGEGLARLDAAEPTPQPGGKGQAPPTEAMMRFGGAKPVVVELAGFIRRDDGPTLDRLTLRDDTDRTQVGARLLETRLELKEGAWVLAGAVPSDKEGVTLVVLVKAVRVEK